MVTVPGMACDDARTLATEECQRPSADVIMSPSALTACPSDVELFGSGEYPDGETSVRPLIFKWETSAAPEPWPEPDPKPEPELGPELNLTTNQALEETVRSLQAEAQGENRPANT